MKSDSQFLADMVTDINTGLVNAYRAGQNSVTPRKPSKDLLLELDIDIIAYGKKLGSTTVSVYGNIVEAESESLPGRGTVLSLPRGVSEFTAEIGEKEVYLGSEIEQSLIDMVLEE